MTASFSHADLCLLAVKWLKRAQSQGGHGCQVAFSECQSGLAGEIPDAIGFRANSADSSVVVEVKVSRADFLADHKKPHRSETAGMGNWRYYMCPEGMIRPEDLPVGWGLLWVNSRGHIKAQAGPAVAAKEGYHAWAASLKEYRNEADLERERGLLVKLLSRVGDPQELNLKLRDVYREQTRLINKCNSQKAEIEELKKQLMVFRLSVDAADAATTITSLKQSIRSRLQLDQ